MITWINLWLGIVALTFIGLTIYLPVKEIAETRKLKTYEPDGTYWFTVILVSGFCAFLVACIGIATTVWYPFTDNEIEHGTYEYNQEYITENIIYNERFSDGHSVFIDGKEFVCDEAITKDVEDFKIMKSEYVWKNGFHKFFYDSFFFKPEQKYQLVIPEKYFNEK